MSNLSPFRTKFIREGPLDKLEAQFAEPATFFGIAEQETTKIVSWQKEFVGADDPFTDRIFTFKVSAVPRRPEPGDKLTQEDGTEWIVIKVRETVGGSFETRCRAPEERT